MKLNLNQEGKYLLAVSGGVDSMVLLDLFLRSNYKFEVLNVDHGTLQEADLIIEHLKSLPIKLHLRKLEQAPKANKEAVWREFRRKAFAEFQAQGFVVVTAHHADDLLETSVMKLATGTSLQGLVNMASSREIVRPLLSYVKAHIYEYAKVHGLRYFEDPSNLNLDFTRNLLRAKVLPNVYKYLPNFRTGFLRTLKNLAEILDFLKLHDAKLLENSLVETFWGNKVDKKLFKALHVYERKVILKDLIGPLSAQKLNALLDLCEGPASKQFQNKGKFLYVAADHFLVSSFSLQAIWSHLQGEFALASDKQPKAYNQRAKIPFYLLGPNYEFNILKIRDKGLGKFKELW